MNTRDTMPAARILHVDDQPETHEWLKLALERKQYEVTVATDGQSALNSFTTHRPDVVLLDHELPDQSGLEVLRAKAPSTSSRNRSSSRSSKPSWTRPSRTGTFTPKRPACA